MPSKISVAIERRWQFSPHEGFDLINQCLGDRDLDADMPSGKQQFNLETFEAEPFERAAELSKKRVSELTALKQSEQLKQKDSAKDANAVRQDVRQLRSQSQQAVQQFKQQLHQEEQQQGLSREQYRAFVRATPAIVRSHRTEAPLTTISRRREASGRGQGREAFV